jgi:hypothetical protein
LDIVIYEDGERIVVHHLTGHYCEVAPALVRICTPDSILGSRLNLESPY